jgi:lethal(2) giant larvae protein
LCPVREILVVAGTAGQVLIMSINEQSRDLPASQIQTQKINLIGVSPEVESHFVWKGHEPLQTRSPTATIKLNAGYQIHSLIQLYPPATISALALNTDWQLVSIGTSHGFALFDYLQAKPLLIRCTLDPVTLLQSQNPNDSGGNMISRRKSLKKSLRETYRTVRRGRSQKNANSRNNNNASVITRLNQLPNSNQMRVEHMDEDDMHHKPVERQVESREFKPMDDIPPSVIRYMYCVRTCITTKQQ